MPVGSDALTYIGTVPADLIGFAVAGVLLAILGFTRGKRVLVALTFALYPAAALASAFPYYDAVLGSVQTAAAHTLVFALLAGALTYPLSRYADGGFSPSGVWRMVECGVLAIAAVGFAAATFAHIPGYAAVYALSPLAESLFTTPVAYFAWLMAPLVALVGFVRA